MRDALKAEICMFNVESLSELRLLDEVAREMGVRAPVALRVNPDVDPETHPYIATGLKTSKFGIPIAQALDAYREAAGLEGLGVVRRAVHHGSPRPQARRRRGRVGGGAAAREAGDCRAKDREPAPAEEGNLLSVMSAGAYGFVMS